MPATGITSGDARKLNVSGGTMVGPLVLVADPTADLQAVTKHYVDSQVLSGGFYEHSQGIPADVWTVHHNLGFRPNVAIVGTDGAVVEASVRHLDTDSLTISFSEAFAGTATCS